VIDFLKRIKFLLFIAFIMYIALMFGDDFPLSIKQFFYTFSYIIRSVLLFILPFVVLPFLLSSIMLLKSRGIWLVIGILCLIFISNFIAILASYGITLPIIEKLHVSMVPSLTQNGPLQPLIEFELPSLITIEQTLLFGFLAGLILSYKSTPAIDKFIEAYRHLASGFLSKIFVPLLPIYIFGVLLQTSHETDFMEVFSTFGGMIILIFLTQVLYTFSLFFIGCQGNFPQIWTCIQRTLPASFLGFSSLSSVVTMPVTLEAAEKNLEDKVIARIAITSTVNTHVVGDCLGLPIIALTIYYLHFGALPDFSTYIIFAFFLSLAQFSAVSVPGGSIVVLTPFLISKLGYTNEMVGLITALSIFLEPLGTSFNVTGNSAFALIIKRLFTLFDKQKG